MPGRTHDVADMMKTSILSLALAIAEGHASPEERAQVESNPELAAQVEEFRRLLGALAEARAFDAPPDHLMHWARVWARQAAPARPSMVSRLMEVLAFGVPQTAAVRGVRAGGPAVLYGSEAHQLDVRLEPRKDGTFRMRAQIVPTGDIDDDSRPWSIRMVGTQGSVFRTLSDEDGGFRFDSLPDVAGLSLVAERGTERLIVPRLVAPANEEETEQYRADDDQ
jgi:hypothetical protein